MKKPSENRDLRAIPPANASSPLANQVDSETRSMPATAEIEFQAARNLQVAAATLSGSGTIGPLESYAPYLKLMARMNWAAGLGGKVDPSDIVQQALLVAHRERNQFKGRSEGEWLGWLRAILATTISSSLRHFTTQGRDLARERSLEGALDHSNARLDAIAALAADQSSPSERVIQREESVLLANALAQLSSDEQQAIELHHLQGLAVAEVADRMQRTRAAVAGLLFRGLKRLRSLLGPSGLSGPSGSSGPLKLASPGDGAP